VRNKGLASACMVCVRMALRGVQAVYRGAMLEVLSRVILLCDSYCIAIGAKQLSVLMLKEGPWEGCCLGVKEMDWLGG
jgi:hypothetical protein